MKITKVDILNFRLLENITIDFDDIVTLIVGKNNSGKTSLMDIFSIFFSSNEKSKFKFEDFTLNSHKLFLESEKFYEDYVQSKETNEDESKIFEKMDLYKSKIPKIVMKIFLEYNEKDDGILAPISNFMMDLDNSRKDALISCEYGIIEPEKLFIAYKKSTYFVKKDFIDFLKNNLQFFEKKFFAVDKNNTNSRSQIERPSDIEKVFLPRFIHAQTNLDDKSDDNSKGLSRGFENYYKHNEKDDTASFDLKKSLEVTSESLDINYKDFFKTIYNDLKDFGVNRGINIQEIVMKSHFEVEEVLKDNASLFYKHENDALLPEKSNGLGYSKLIYIILTILSYYEEQNKKKTPPNFGLLFIEEPEAHLHPQMQQTFIKNINDYIKKKNWNVQIIITTHSPHIVGDCKLDSIRYFDISSNTTLVKNLTSFNPKLPGTLDFLKQYLTLYHCDMFFADKIIMVEGTVERLLLPKMIQIEAPELINQYVSIIEVGGAYANKFKELLEFLNVKTLIITDIDTVKKQNGKFISCPVSDGERTCNPTLKNWLPKKMKPDDLLKCKENEKLDNFKKIKVSYQIPGDTLYHCGRSFEQAFILENAEILSSNKVKFISYKLFLEKIHNKYSTNNKTKDQIIDDSYIIAGKLSKKKTIFAFDILSLEKWHVPKYIKEGLQWLEK